MIYELDERWHPSSPIRRGCRHRFWNADHACAAFPDGIPLEIWNGPRNHDTPFPGDHGIVFEPMTEDDLRAYDEHLARGAERFEDLKRRVLAERERRAS